MLLRMRVCLTVWPDVDRRRAMDDGSPRFGGLDSLRLR